MSSLSSTSKFFYFKPKGVYVRREKMPLDYLPRSELKKLCIKAGYTSEELAAKGVEPLRELLKKKRH